MKHCQNFNLVILILCSVLTRVFKNGVDISEQSSGLTICFYNTAQDRPTLAMGVTKRSLCDQNALRNVVIMIGTNRPENTFNINSHTIPGTLESTSTILLSVHISDSKFYENIGGGVNIELYGIQKYQECSFKETKTQLEAA